MTTPQTAPTAFADGIVVTGPMAPGYDEILTPEAMAFVARLNRTFNARRLALLEQRARRQELFDAGQMPDFLPETAEVRAADWTIAPIPPDLQDRRVEITGPVDRKMVINALNSGARVFMADFEDADSPTWANQVEGQANLRDAIRRTISFSSPEGKEYRLNERVAVLFARPRGWHLPEKHISQDGEPISGSLFDFGLYAFHNARELLARGTGPYFYLPKLESHLEARLWNDVFTLAEQALGIPAGSIKATVLIETLPAAFEMDEILYELRDHSAGLNCGRWDYIFSAIKKRRNDPTFILPDRVQVTMTTHFMRSYTLLCIQTCHRRGAHAMGGMAAFIPVKSDPEVNERALAQVRADKEREASDGHDGTWVAHPGLVALATECFDRVMPQPNQIERKREDVRVAAADLLVVPEGTITEAGLRTNISVGIQYLESWLRGQGCVPINNLMEDAATAEISRAQVWQWIRHPRGVLNDGRKVTVELFREIMREELASIEQTIGTEVYARRAFGTASEIFDAITTSDEFVDFLTLPAYDYLP
ncbi:MAG TPA: malate synthase A [Ktedonobacterales bacterium]|nr:malate synthase A [Ktedonobacterales bacterium]